LERRSQLVLMHCDTGEERISRHTEAVILEKEESAGAQVLKKRNQQVFMNCDTGEKESASLHAL
jgi:homoserine trans-succinylase